MAFATSHSSVTGKGFAFGDEHIGKWFNRTYRRKGAFWAERFSCTWVEPSSFVQPLIDDGIGIRIGARLGGSLVLGYFRWLRDTPLVICFLDPLL